MHQLEIITRTQLLLPLNHIYYNRNQIQNLTHKKENSHFNNFSSKNSIHFNTSVKAIDSND